MIISVNYCIITQYKAKHKHGVLQEILFNKVTQPLAGMLIKTAVQQLNTLNEQGKPPKQ